MAQMEPAYGPPITVTWTHDWELARTYYRLSHGTITIRRRPPALMGDTPDVLLVNSGQIKAEIVTPGNRFPYPLRINGVEFIGTTVLDMRTFRIDDPKTWPALMRTQTGRTLAVPPAARERAVAILHAVATHWMGPPDWPRMRHATDAHYADVMLARIRCATDSARREQETQAATLAALAARETYLTDTKRKVPAV